MVSYYFDSYLSKALFDVDLDQDQSHQKLPIIN